MATIETNHNFKEDSEAEDQQHKAPDTSGSSITHWSVEAGEVKDGVEADLIKIATENLAEDAVTKVTGLRFLEENDLPRYQKVMVNLKSFLHNPQRVFAKLPSASGLYYSSIVNLTTGERVFGLDQDQEAVKKFIREKLKNEEISPDSQLILSEYWRNYYGGNLVINERGKIFAELVEGKHAKLDKGEGQIFLGAKTSDYSETLQFSEKQEMSDELKTQLRRAIIKAIELIPKHLVPLSDNPTRRFKDAVVDEAGEAAVSVPVAGYFEFILTKKDQQMDNFEVIFIDARTGDAAKKYQLLE